MIDEKRTERLHRDIVSDSHRVVSAKDPPGQRCVYIYPGDTEREVYRLTTYDKFPRHIPVEPLQLASAGFYYTGYKDRVKCFSCGSTIEDWTLTDDPKSRDLHDVNCEMMLSTCTRNQPINSGWRRPFRRSPSPTTSQNQPTPSQITRQTSSAGEVTMAGITNQTNPPINHQYQSATISSTLTNQTHHNNEQMQSNFIELFPCRNPANPHMRSALSREQTFLDNNNWPGHRIRATPHQIAEAGMFYLGNRDRVKCWYCNGGLQNWDTSDDPWFEHAKWFPECEFLLQSKGPEFVEMVVDQYPNLRRPTQRNNTQTNQLNRSQSTSNAPPIIIDPQEEIQERNRKVENEMTNSSFVDEAKKMGFSEEEIKQAFYRQFESSNTSFVNFAPLVESLLAHTKPNSENQSVPMDTEAPSTSSATVPKQSAPTSALEELRILEKSRSCKSCRKEVASVVFIPCGHLAACPECSKSLKKCPVCNKKITESFKTFLS